MATALRRLSCELLIVALGLWPCVVDAVCISPVITPTECDFKDEDTNLIVNQPALYFVRQDNVERLLADAETFIHNYYSSTKATGDAGIIAMIATLAAEIRQVEISQVANTALILANDPWSLKPAYTDALCDAFWSAQAVESGVERTCPTTPELLVEVEKILQLEERAQAIEAILGNEFRILGEVWGDLEADFDRVRNKFKNPQSISRNLGADELVARYDNTYSSLEQMLTQPLKSLEEWRSAYQGMDETMNHTLQDTLLATQGGGQNLLGRDFFATPEEIANFLTPENVADTTEILEHRDRNRHSVGRMQQLELRNMAASLSGQSLVDITTQISTTGYLMGLDMAQELSTDNFQRSREIFAAEELPPEEKRRNINNGMGYRP